MGNNNNIISISSELINHDLRKQILSVTRMYVTDYKVSFSSGYIYLDLKLRIKTLGDISAKYRLQVTSLSFNSQEHVLKVSYQEDVKSTGSLSQNIMLKAVGLKGGTFLQNVISMVNPLGIRADEKNCSIKLEQLFNLKSGVISQLSLNYLDSRDNSLKISFNVNPS